jgi:hypothetical protein
MSLPRKRRRFAWSLWIPVILAFLLVISAWTLLIKIAAENPVELIEMDARP